MRLPSSNPHFPTFSTLFDVLLFLVTLWFCFLIFADICQDNIIIMATQFGERIRELRTKQNLLLRQLASLLDVDTSIISKVERGDRQLKKEQIPLLAEILKASSDELMTLWLADQIYAVVKDEKLANEAMDIAEGQLKNKNKRLK
jgi:transcriptional regulator with XRE-family HTH domain